MPNSANMRATGLATSRPIRFYLNNELTTLDAVPPTRTVLAWLREEQRLNRQAAY
jgi:xanthine dehydrogenase iron-sulfur cluster and FAD-binding subunit A